jgi:hypothetical protein
MLPGHAMGLALPKSGSREGVANRGLGAVHPPPQADCAGAGVPGAAQSPKPSSSSAQGDFPRAVGIFGALEMAKKARGGGSRSDRVDLAGEGGLISLSVSVVVHGEPQGSSILLSDSFHAARVEGAMSDEACRCFALQRQFFARGWLGGGSSNGDVVLQDARGSRGVGRRQRWEARSC